MVRRRLLKDLRQQLGTPLVDADVEHGLAVIIDIVTTHLTDRPGESIVIGIAGGSGSGKTSQVAQGLARAFEREAVVVPMDNYYRGAAALAKVNRPVSWDEPAAIELELLATHLSELRQGRRVEMPVYDFTVGERLGYRPMMPRPIIIVEGLFTLNDALLPLLDIRLYVAVDVHGQIIRRLLRDITRTGQAPTDILWYMADTAIPMHQRFVETLRPQADLVLINDYRPETESAKRRFAGLQLKKSGWPEPSRLEDLGAEYLGHLHQEDTYLESPAGSLHDHGEILRLRQEGRRITMTYKGPAIGEQGERFVFTCSVDEPTAAGLQCLYRSSQTIVQKERSLYLLEGAVLQLDDVTIGSGTEAPNISRRLVTELRLVPGRTTDSRVVLDALFNRLGLLGEATTASYEQLAQRSDWFLFPR